MNALVYWIGWLAIGCWAVMVGLIVLFLFTQWLHRLRVWLARVISP